MDNFVNSVSDTQKPLNSTNAPSSPPAPSSTLTTQDMEGLKLAAEKEDLMAKGILDLYEIFKQIKSESSIIKEDLKKESRAIKSESSIIKEDLKKSNDDLKKIDRFMTAVVIGVSIAFIIGFLTVVVSVLALYFNQIQDKQLYLKYNDVFKDYSDATNSQQTKINDIEQQLNLLKARNSYLK